MPSALKNSLKGNKTSKLRIEVKILKRAFDKVSAIIEGLKCYSFQYYVHTLYGYPWHTGANSLTFYPKKSMVFDR